MSRFPVRRVPQPWWLLAGLLAIALAGAAALAGQAPSGPESAKTSAQPTTAVDEAAWFRIRRDGAGLVLDIGTIATGRTTTEPIADEAGPPTADGTMVGVAQDAIVFLDNDVDESRVVIVDAITGEARVLMRTVGALIAGQLSPDNDTAYVVEAEREEQRVTAIVAIDTATGATRRVSDLRRAGFQRVHGFHVSLDGSRLAVDGCGADDCEVRLVDVRSGASSPLIAGQGVGLVGLASRYAVPPPPCDDLPCGHWLIDLSTGDRVAKPEAAKRYISSAVARGADGHELVVGQLTGIASWGVVPRGETEPPILEVVDLTDGRPLEPVQPDLYALNIVRTVDPTIGAELPAGWVLVSGMTHRFDELVSYFAVELRTGRVQPLPDLGEFERPA